MMDVERIRKDLETLAGCTATPGEGITRLAFTPEEIKARGYLKGEMEAAGLEVSQDTAGNIFGRRRGRRDDAPPVLFGSHIDSVVHGGAFDGTAGIVAALEAMRHFHTEGIETEHPLEMVVMTEEEGGRFGSGLWGSRAMAGKVTRKEVEENTDAHGVTKARALQEFGIDPARVPEAARKPGSIKAFLELHIEQGPVLEEEGFDAGIVDSIVGIRILNVTVRGRSDHAGTTPMDYRRDPLVGASRVVAAIDGIARNAGHGAVATVGMLTAEPGAFNIIPGEVRFTVDLRCSQEDVIEHINGEIERTLDEVCHHAGLEWSLEHRLTVQPVQVDSQIIRTFQDVAREKGISAHVMPSGAGHDAMVMAAVAPMGMLFVPSRSGKSHCPEEWTDYDKVAKGAELLEGAVRRLAG
ncbi:MAG: Zn-dependent hydrolase [Synergistales bacterium]|nr:Zn-dependent hydrolase [Synergistales bacterium]